MFKIPSKIRHAALFAAASIMVSSAASAQEQLSIGTSSSGSGPYINGATISEVFNNAQDKYKLSVQTTGGYRDNLGLVLNSELDIALNTLIDLEFAYNKRNDFANIPIADEFKNLRQLFIFSVVPENVFVREDSGITSLEGIKGHAINLNTPSSFTYGLNLELLKAAGLSTDDIKAGTVSTGQVFDEIRNGVFDGGMHVFQVGLANAQQLSSTVPMRYLNLDPEVIERLNEVYYDLLVPFEVPAGTYRGQDEPVSTFGLAQVIYTDAEADEDMIYEFTKAFWENLQALGESNTSFKGLTVELGAQKRTVPMHPGAERYFKEIGALAD
ncbi:TAXI family TRAP transporter solute-binding subunit [Nitratireductor aquimarinus]|uniref:TAXI family TRAP transporter solute-binding subunit n=1 Tax=Nitratireductor TaxID=245876 RepID=UPI0019D3D7DD|nr:MULTISPECIES: TAXI family TRAP transporter solute-binding subunit [Nitratireductor]MBN7776507.1 TAXI family TRAP transporter solute-binding subunit [Nitratireductor pacificus]MBN7779374.1 TAXI family TRAP transporter solute-binding subunit [Nitratireductor pacificus]MBN7788181.1 TAXI family TRAP transporter solute-binding subunit [Nitratireductor aquimarinus]MBY6098228.1 TAXI family TRAP transporter solute-binding subunit [Nitratireductor aquimarinus]MCA1259206.1 TAXI family TRAP transporte